MSTIQLNLARKWRSKTFHDIVGQDLSVKMLKNSLYLNHFFPVYLFAGQKGCGKTSTARVFAAAVNCEQLASFQRDPKNITVPCLTCSSCDAMQRGKHPDFIEIDAASNTGVDNVRNIIDAASLLPLMGRKKIYLIDEAHMLSKAAFNAFLKLLEEPPVSVLFMLATTDTQKIIDTVRSRCFQLQFKPIEQELLAKHLQMICDNEHITYEKGGLYRIVQETGGCARDALNLMEQVRFSHPVITTSSVTMVLGYLDDASIIELYTLAINKQATDLFSYIYKLSLEHYSAEYIWKRLVELIRAIMLIKCSIAPKQFEHHYDQLVALAQHHSWEMLERIMSLMYEHEATFLKTTAQHACIEMLFLRFAHLGDSVIANQVNPIKISTPPVAAIKDVVIDRPSPAPLSNASQKPIPDAAPVVQTVSVLPREQGDQWQNFLREVQTLNDPLLVSLFSQASCLSYDSSSGVVSVQFSKEMAFFNDWLDNTKALWQPVLRKHFSAQATMQVKFAADDSSTARAEHAADVKKKVDSKSEAAPRAPQVTGVIQKEKNSSSEQRYSYEKKTGTASAGKSNIDVSDAAVWKKTHLLLRYFPGIVREIQES